METNLQTLDKEKAAHKVEVDWPEAEWFQVWLQLARRDYHGHPCGSELHDDDGAPLAATATSSFQVARGRLDVPMVLLQRVKSGRVITIS
jgi:hypothetical protein